MNSSSDPRQPFIFGLIGLAVLMIGGIAWAVMAQPTKQGSGTQDVNVSFNDANDPVRGPADAKVVVREFEDLECSACRVAKAGVDYVMQKYGDQVKFIWNDMPLTTLHPHALEAANAARCAEEQGKFWEYHDVLYQQQPYWASATNVGDLFAQYASGLGMNMQAFSSCVADKTYESKITADGQEGTAAGIDATPTFFVNNVRYVGVLSNDEWDAAIQKALGK
ncbi:MAG: thioredoxin domain-containing protein [Patescibacteria group bacterium]